jgi:hypothetical protein
MGLDERLKLVSEITFQVTLPDLSFWQLLGVAEGAKYLHSCEPPIIHGDIKPVRILRMTFIQT